MQVCVYVVRSLDYLTEEPVHHLPIKHNGHIQISDGTL